MGFQKLILIQKSAILIQILVIVVLKQALNGNKMSCNGLEYGVSVEMWSVHVIHIHGVEF